MLSVHEAAKRLGVSDRRVRALIDSGRLDAQRVGRAWIIHPIALASVDGARSPGRPLSARSAWAELIGERPAPQVDSSMMRSRYRGRSERFELDGPNVGASIELSLVRESGWLAAMEFDRLLDEDASKPRVVYLASSSFNAWCERHWLVPSPTCRVIAHVVSDEVASTLLAFSQQFVPPRVASVDLAEVGGVRGIEAALRIWQN
jgi:excisionase family DNA binding protein